MKLCSFSMLSGLLLAVTTLIGCGGESDMPELGRVNGTATLNGEPLKDASILFHPTKGGRSSTATTDDKGNYTLQYNSDTAGAQVGEHEVTISTYREPADDPEGNLIPGRQEEVPKKYSTTDIIKVEVKPGENEIDLKLES